MEYGGSMEGYFPYFHMFSTQGRGGSRIDEKDVECITVIVNVGEIAFQWCP